jgi:hypothetical protein
MRNYLLSLIYFLFLIGFSSLGTATIYSAAAAGNEVTPIAERLRQIAEEFKALRTICGHFDGGTRNDDVDQWMGRKHRLMLQISTLVAESDYSRSEIIQLLNPPDRIVRKGDNLYDQIAALRDHSILDFPSEEYLIYYWRGMHDYLYFTCRNRMIVSADWWYAGE